MATASSSPASSSHEGKSQKHDDGVDSIVCPQLTKTFDQAIAGLRLESRPRVEKLKANEVRVSIHASALNFFDLLGFVGRYQVKFTPPYVIGAEAAGRITEVGSGVKYFKVGQDVCLAMAVGVFASEAVVPELACVPMPSGWSYVSAAALPVGFQTAYHGLVHRGKVQKGETVLITGAAGGMGAAAVQLAVALGANVIAVCSTQDKAEWCKTALGAQHAVVLDPKKLDDFKAQVGTITKGRMVDVAYELVGGTAFDACVRTLGWNGRLLVVGFAGGTIPQLSVNLALVKSLSVIGVAAGASMMRNPKIALDMATQLPVLTAQGKLPPPKVPTSQVFNARTEFATAFQRMADRAVMGKVVLQWTPTASQPTAAANGPRSKL